MSLRDVLVENGFITAAQAEWYDAEFRRTMSRIESECLNA